MSTNSPSGRKVHSPRPSKSPLATSRKPYGYRSSTTSNCHRSVYGSHPFVWSLTTLPRPLTSAGRTSQTSRYTEGHQRGSDSGSPSTSATSPHVPSTHHLETKWYSLLWCGNRLSVSIEERDVLERGELILHLRPIADDRNHRILRSEQRRRRVFHLIGRDRRDLRAERLRVVLRQSEDVHVVQRAGKTGLRRGLNREDPSQIRLGALQLG